MSDDTTKASIVMQKQEAKDAKKQAIDLDVSFSSFGGTAIRFFTWVFANIGFGDREKIRTIFFADQNEIPKQCLIIASNHLGTKHPQLKKDFSDILSKLQALEKNSSYPSQALSEKTKEEA